MVTCYYNNTRVILSIHKQWLHVVTDNSTLFQNIPHNNTQDIQLNVTYTIKPNSTKCTIIKD